MYYKLHMNLTDEIATENPWGIVIFPDTQYFEPLIFFCPLADGRQRDSVWK